MTTTTRRTTLRETSVSRYHRGTIEGPWNPSYITALLYGGAEGRPSIRPPEVSRDSECKFSQYVEERWLKLSEPSHDQNSHYYNRYTTFIRQSRTCSSERTLAVSDDLTLNNKLTLIIFYFSSTVYI